jgi:hypothetical protein
MLIVHISLLLNVVKIRDLYTANQEICGINTRNNTNLHLPKANLTAFQRGANFFFFKKLFNHIPTNIKNLSNETKLFICLFIFTFHGSFGINPLDKGTVKHKQKHINKIELCTVIMICCNEHVIVMNRTIYTSQSIINE